MVKFMEDMDMATGKNTGGKGDFRIEGKVQLEDGDRQAAEFKLTAYAFDKLGGFLGEQEVNAQGGFSMALNLAQAMDVEVVIGPQGEPRTVRQSSAFVQKFSVKDWLGEGSKFQLRPNIFVPRDIWWPWHPRRICVSGHVRKTQDHGAPCPVPFVKVEIFDVDREFCWWPWLHRLRDVVIDRPVIRIPDLLKQPPFRKPIPEPDPAPYFNIGDAVALNPQPLPPRAMMADLHAHADNVTSVDVQPMMLNKAEAVSTALMSKLDKVTLTSRVAPWKIFPHCFYSKQLLCETYTDCNGYFRCCFSWWPFHFRRGTVRFDSRPDIIVRVTQIINGVETVIYMDPYTSTRWNVTNAHIDLFLDNEEVRCGQGCTPQPVGAATFFTRIGNDEVYQINQASGLYNDATYSNVAYGSALAIYGQFGDDLADGVPKRYYRLSYAKQGSSNFKYIDADLTDTRVNKVTLMSESYNLGPQPVNGTTTLYEVRNRAGYYWYNTDWIGTWSTALAEADTGTYVLRLEVFNENGAHLTTASGQVDYRDGTVVPPAVLPAMIDHCDLVITLDNKAPVVDLQIPAVLNECGVIPWSAVPPLDFNVSVSQENGRLHSWGLQYTKGVNPAVIGLASGSSNTGFPGTVNTIVSGAPMLVGLNTTCAFALKLWAWPHTRNGYGFIYYEEQIKAIAIEKCS